jgi:hypothetical protein
MATFRPYVNKAGTTTQLQDTDTLLAGNGVTTDAGSLTLDSATSSLVLAAALAVTAATGVTFDLSGSAGLFKTTTGPVTIGPGAVTQSGVTTFTAAGTAVVVNNNATVTGLTTATGGVQTGAAGVDATGAIALVLGGVNASEVKIGKVAALTTILGNFQVNGTELVVGMTTFDGAVQFGAPGFPIAVTAGDVGTTFDMSASAGLFKTTTGPVSLAGNTTVLAGKVLGTTGTGNINLPLNVSAKFQIEGVSVNNTLGVGQVTAANLDTVTAGPASIADALHTHAGIGGSATSVIDTTLTTAAMTASGQAAYISANDTVSPTNNSAIASARFYGFFTGTAGQVQVAGMVASALMTTAGGSPAPGAPVFLAATTDDAGTGAGKLTATAPVALGSVIQEVGICRSNDNYAVLKTAKVLIQPKAVIQL